MSRDFLMTPSLSLRRAGRHREVDEELAFHLERQVEANVAAGMTAEEARRQAAIAFGGVERAREQCREARPGYLWRCWCRMCDMRFGDFGAIRFLR